MVPASGLIGNRKFSLKSVDAPPHEGTIKVFFECSVGYLVDMSRIYEAWCKWIHWGVRKNIPPGFNVLHISFINSIKGNLLSGA